MRSLRIPVEHDVADMQDHPEFLKKAGVRTGDIVQPTTKGDRLRAARTAAGFRSAAAAAKFIGVAGSTYAAHENGQNNFDEHDAQLYGAAFGIPWQRLLVGEAGDTDGAARPKAYASPIADRIRELLDLRGMTANALEARIYRSDAVRNILRVGAHHPNYFPRIDTLLAIADGLRTSLEWLATGNGERDLGAAATSDDSASYVWILADEASTTMTRAEAERKALEFGRPAIIARIVSQVTINPKLEVVP
jgi:transcriptional regulator with XRE-family HTH domain